MRGETDLWRPAVCPSGISIKGNLWRCLRRCMRCCPSCSMQSESQYSCGSRGRCPSPGSCFDVLSWVLPPRRRLTSSISGVVAVPGVAGACCNASGSGSTEYGAPENAFPATRHPCLISMLLRSAFPSSSGVHRLASVLRSQAKADVVRISSPHQVPVALAGDASRSASTVSSGPEDGSSTPLYHIATFGCPFGSLW